MKRTTVKLDFISAALIFIILLGFSTAYSFDGKRKGFVAGLGLGGSLVANWSSDYGHFDIDEGGYGVNLMIGYAWNNRNMIVYEGNGALYEAAYFDKGSMMQILDAVSWYHYWGKQHPNFFAMVGLGQMTLGSEYCNIGGDGFGYMAGAGYELLKQVQIGIYYIGGHTSNHYGIKADHSVLNLLVTVVAY